MLDTLAHLQYWHWIVAGLVFVTIEMFVPGAFFFGMGLAALIVGTALWLAPEFPWQWQLFSFAVLALISIVAGRHWIKSRPIETDQPLLNQRGAQYIGRTFTLIEAMDNGQSKIRVDDTTWRVRGDEGHAGDPVRVTGVDGVMLLVEKVRED